MPWFVRSSIARSLLVVVLAVLVGRASAQDRGFRLHRYEGSSAGGAHFLVERPTYSALRFGAAGLTLDYSHAPLVPRLLTGRGAIEPIVSQALIGHLDLSLSFLDRFLLSASLPVTFLESGTPELVSQVGPLQTVGVGDPRVGVMVRLAGQAERDPVSLHLGAELWIPLGGQATHQGDGAVRVMPRAVLAGSFAEVGRWTVDAAFLLRPYASLGPPALGMTAASEARVGLGLGVALAHERLFLGPEAQFAMQVAGANAFALNGMNLELLGGAQYLIADRLLVGVAGGSAFFGAAGTPDARAVVRLAWAPRRSTEPERVVLSGALGETRSDDPDGDGLPTATDRCPFEPESVNGVRDGDGCPEFQLEQGAPLARVLAPMSAGLFSGAALDAGSGGRDAGALGSDGGSSTPLGENGSTSGDAGSSTPLGENGGALRIRGDGGPSLGESGGALVPVAFSTADSDGDGVPDEADRCPVVREDPDGFEDEDGCPEADNDQDGLADAVDTCPVEAETLNGLDDTDGCPDVAPDGDNDGVADAVDRCPLEPETTDGVRDEDGCPELPAAWSEALSLILSPSTSPSRAVSSQPIDPKPKDSDRDGVADEADRCPVTAEDLDGFEDEDGCPEPDNDADGIADAADRCADVAETVNGWKDDDGCPDEHQDIDSDGVEYDADRCPFEPGGAPDGCPHAPLPALALAGFPGAPPTPSGGEPPAASTADLDRDGTPDEADRCPVRAEDADGFEDEDGCPEPDNDHDGVADAKDKCPFVAETINGIADTDGCPDVGAGVVTIKANAVVINGVVRFKTASATLQPASLPLLQQVASTLRAAASLSIEIQGHTDDVGNAAQNIKLSKRRAESIRAVLVKAGVAPARLIATGFGPTRPRASNKTPEGREQNRRVEFLILGESK